MKGKKNRGARVALAGMLSALGVAVMFVCDATGVLNLTGICVASFLVAIAVAELGGAYPYLIWGVTGTVAFLLLPDKSTAATYVLFGGIYPMLKLYFERLGRIGEWAAKLCYGILVFGVLYALSKFVFGIPDESKPVMIALGVGCAVFFVLYDYALSVGMTLYWVKIRPKLTFLKRLK